MSKSKPRTSHIFSNGELAEMERRKKGNFKDETGVYANQLKPKLIELIDVWFPKFKELVELTRKRR